jgi:hypothetical protein
VAQPDVVLAPAAVSQYGVVEMFSNSGRNLSLPNRIEEPAVFRTKP